MKKRMLSLLLALVMVLCMMPDMGLKAYAWVKPDVAVTDATYYDSGAMKSITAQIGWHSGGAKSRLVLSTKYLRSAGETGTDASYGDFTDLGYYGDNNTFSNTTEGGAWDEVKAYDEDSATAGTFGILKYSEAKAMSDSSKTSFTLSLDESTMAADGMYYGYVWTYFGSEYYPDALAFVVKVQDGVVQYVPGKFANNYDRNSYDSSKFTDVVSQTKYDVTVTPAANMTKAAGSGEASQTDLGVPMTPVVYTADNGYYFPNTYAVSSVTGIKVTRDSATQITVSGMPTANTTITLTAPTLLPMEEIVFPYAYDVQRSKSYPNVSDKINLTGKDSQYAFPLIGWKTRGDSYGDNWTLTKIGNFGLIDGSSKDSDNLSAIIGNVAGGYQITDATAKNNLVLHELKRDGQHIAYGVVIAWDNVNGYALFLGDTWEASNGGAGYLLSLKTATPTTTMTATTVATGWVAPPVYDITVTEVAGQESYGEATASMTRTVEGDTVTITVTPAAGYEVDSVTCSNNVTVNPVGSNQYTFTMPASAVTVTVAYKASQHDVTVDSASQTNGTTTVSANKATAGTTITITATPATGYEIGSVKYNDGTDHEVTPTGGEYKFTMPETNVTVKVTYRIKTYTVIYKNEGGSTVYTESVAHGESVASVPAVPDKTGHTGEWDNNGTNITGATTITAIYTPIDYIVTFTAGGVKKGEKTVAYGSKVNASDIPAVPSKEGYLGKWIYNGAEFTAETEILGNTDVVAVYTINDVEKITFPYAYDAQRNPAFPEKGKDITLSGLNFPIISKDSRGTTNDGSWTLTKIGTYGIVKNTDRDTAYLRDIIASVKAAYGIEANKVDGIVLHELKNGDEHIAYGVLLTYDAEKGFAIFVGDTWAGGAGYLLSLDPQSGSVSGKASIGIEDILPPTMYDVSIDDAAKVNGTVSAVTKAVAGDTVTIHVAPATGYKIAKVTYNDGQDHEVVLTEGKGTFTMPATAVVIKVTYEKLEYTVTYMIDGQVKGTEKVKYQEDAQNFPTIPAKTGYDQVAPAWDHDGKNITADTTINAVYTINTYTVTYVVDGRGVKTEVVEWGKDATAPAVPAKDGYTGAWDEEAKNVKENLIIEAVYTKNKQDQPEKPEEPQKPEEPSQPTTSAPATNPDTGDNSHLGLWIAMVLASCGALILIDRKKRYHIN